MNFVTRWQEVSPLKPRFVIASLLLVAAYLITLRIYDPLNYCVEDKDIALSTVGNGVALGTVYGVLGLGIALVYQRFGTALFAHGALFMLGGWVAASTVATLPAPVLAVPLATAAGFVVAIGLYYLLVRKAAGNAQRLLLTTLAVSYFGFFLAEAAFDFGATFGRIRLPADQYINLPVIRIPADALPPLLITSTDFLSILDLVIISTTRLIAGLMALAALGIVYLWQRRQIGQVGGTTGASHKLSAAKIYIGTATLAAFLGAAFVQTIAWTTDFGTLAMMRGATATVIAGLLTPLGAVLGGLVLGLTEAVGTYCMPNAARGLAYVPAYSFIALAVALAFQPIPAYGARWSGDVLAQAKRALPQKFNRIVGALFLTMLLLPIVQPSATTLGHLSEALFWASLAVGWATFARNHQQYSLAQVAFAGMGAYIVGVAGADFPWLGAAVGVAACGLAAFVVGALTLPHRNLILLPIATLAFGEAVRATVLAEVAVTNGRLGLTLPEVGLGALGLYYLGLGVLGLSLLVLGWVNFGRNNPLLAFVVTAMLAALAGILYFLSAGEIRPTVLRFEQMGIVVALAVIAGRRNPWGVALGVIVGYWLLAGLSAWGFERWQYVALSLLLLAVLRCRPDGLFSQRDL